MKFAAPIFLFGLLALAIPILIHLFNFRKYKRIFFTNVRFLREVQHETQSRNRLKHLLVLASRLLAILFLVFAFAQPFIPRENATVRTGQKRVSIFIDNSFSMDAVNKSGTLLDEAKKDAREIVAAYKADDRFQLLTNDFEGRHQRLLSKEDFLEQLDEVKLSPALRSISEITNRQQDALNAISGTASGNKQAFILSDFQKSISDFSAVKTDTSIQWRTIPIVAQNRNNIYVDSIWFESPVRRIGQQEVLHVRLKSRSEQDMENVPMRLYLNGQAKTPASFNIRANATTDTLIYFTVNEPGLQQGLIEINDYPVTFDDRFYFSFDVLKSIPVLSIRATETNPLLVESDYLQKLFGNDSAFVYAAQEETKIDYATFANYRLIVVNSLQKISSGLATELRKFVDNGGSIVVFPGANADLATYRDLLSPMGCPVLDKPDTVKSIVDKIQFEHPLYKGVFEKSAGNFDLPIAYDHYRISRSSRSAQQPLMTLRNGDLFMSVTPVRKGFVYLCATPLLQAYTNFPRHALFVPTLYQAALFSQPQNKLFYTIDRDATIFPGQVAVASDQVFHLTDPAKKFDVIPAYVNNQGQSELQVHKQVTDPGNYLVQLDTKTITGAAFNYDRRESDLSVLSSDDLIKSMSDAGLIHFSNLDAQGKGYTALLTEQDYGIRLWKICIALTLLFLLAEVLLLRFWRTPNRPAIAQTT